MPPKPRTGSTHSSPPVSKTCPVPSAKQPISWNTSKTTWMPCASSQVHMLHSALPCSEYHASSDDPIVQVHDHRCGTEHPDRRGRRSSVRRVRVWTIEKLVDMKSIRAYHQCISIERRCQDLNAQAARRVPLGKYHRQC